MAKKREAPLPKRFGTSKKKKSHPSVRIVPVAVDSDSSLSTLFRSVVLRPLSHAPVKDVRTARTRVARSREDSDGPSHDFDFFFEGGGVRPSGPVFRQRTTEELWAEARPQVLQQYLKHAPDSEARVIARLRGWASGAQSPQRTCDNCELSLHRVKVISIEATFIASVPVVTCKGCGRLSHAGQHCAQENGTTRIGEPAGNHVVSVPSYTVGCVPASVVASSLACRQCGTQPAEPFAYDCFPATAVHSVSITSATSHMPVWVALPVLALFEPAQYLSKSFLSNHGVAGALVKVHTTLITEPGEYGDIEIVHLTEDTMKRCMTTVLREYRYLSGSVDLIVREHMYHKAHSGVPHPLGPCVVCSEGSDKNMPLPLAANPGEQRGVISFTETITSRPAKVWCLCVVDAAPRI